MFQVVDEILTYWQLDETDDVLEELEEALLVRKGSNGE